MENITTTGLMPLNLQFFAEEGSGEGALPPADGAGQEDGRGPVDNETPPPAEEKPADLNTLLAGNKVLQGQFDKLVTKALETAKGNWEKQKGMSTEELEAEQQREKEAELAAREQALVERENRATVLATLGEKGLPLELVDTINCTNDEALASSLAKVEKAFRAALDKAVAEQLKGAAPPAGQGVPATSLEDKVAQRYASATK